MVVEEVEFPGGSVLMHERDQSKMSTQRYEGHQSGRRKVVGVDKNEMVVPVGDPWAGVCVFVEAFPVIQLLLAQPEFHVAGKGVPWEEHPQTRL
jgi:hypothetical protein